MDGITGFCRQFFHHAIVHADAATQHEFTHVGAVQVSHRLAVAGQGRGERDDVVGEIWRRRTVASLEKGFRQRLAVFDFTNGNVLVDGVSIGGVSDIVLRDRRHLSQDGTVIVTISLDRSNGEVLSGPDIMARGFIEPELATAIFDETVEKVLAALDELNDTEGADLDTVRLTIHEVVAKFLKKKTGRRPVVVPVVMDI